MNPEQQVMSNYAVVFLETNTLSTRVDPQILNLTVRGGHLLFYL